MAKSGLDQALERPTPCPDGATSLSGVACQGSPDKLNSYISRAINDGAGDQDCVDCGEVSGSVDDGSSIEGLYQGLKKKLRHLDEEFRMTRAQFAHGAPRVMKIDIEPRGPRGFTGYPGEVGNTGSMGPQGSQGRMGHKGDDGPMGIQGVAGRMGAKGLTGSIGRPGIGGVEGPKGKTGVTGLAGPKGPRGLPGAMGVNGANGKAGVPGTPGLPSPVGPPGLPGNPGPPGKSGAAGANGTPGASGPRGLTGPSGASGPAGAAGKVGADGVGPPKPKPLGKMTAAGKCWSRDTKCKQLGVADNLCGQCFGADWRTCAAAEGETCMCKGMARYGLEGKWTEEKIVKESIKCSTLAFGEDPAIGKKKTCECAHGFLLVNDEGPLNYKGSSFDDVNYNAKSIQAQNVCLLAGFGNKFHNEEKECGEEGEVCKCGGKVRYGRDGNWSPSKTVESEVLCNNDAFGLDPFPGVTKKCMCSSGKFPSYASDKSFATLQGSGEWKLENKHKVWALTGKKKSDGDKVDQLQHYYGGCKAGADGEGSCCLNSHVVSPGKDFKSFATGNDCIGNEEKGTPWEALTCMDITNNHLPAAPKPKPAKAAPAKPKDESKVKAEDKKTPPALANVLNKDSRSLLNAHCATWRDKAAVKSTREQKRFMAKCMAQDCEQSLEGIGGGCRFVDGDSLCYAYNTAQEWCEENPTNMYCNDGGVAWAVPPIGNSEDGQYKTHWTPRKQVEVKNAEDEKYDCACMKNCACTSSKCWCVDKAQTATGVATDFNSHTIYSSSSKKGKCACSCGGVLGA